VGRSSNYIQTFARSAHNRVTFVVGNNLDEGGAVPETAFRILRSPGTARPEITLGAPNPNVMLKDYLSAANRKFGPMTGEFLRLYPASTDDEAARANNAAIADNSRVSTYSWATEWTRVNKTPVYTYFWTHAPPGRITTGVAPIMDRKSTTSSTISTPQTSHGPTRTGRLPP